MTRIDAAEQTRVFRVQVSPDGQDWHRSSHSSGDHGTDDAAATAALSAYHRSPDLDIRVVEVVTITTPVRWVVPATTTPVQLSSLFTHTDLGSFDVIGWGATITPRCQYDRDDSINEQCVNPAAAGSPFCAPHQALEARP
jgi:hypothetical protein